MEDPRLFDNLPDDIAPMYVEDIAEDDPRIENVDGNGDVVTDESDDNPLTREQYARIVALNAAHALLCVTSSAGAFSSAAITRPEFDDLVALSQYILGGVAQLDADTELIEANEMRSNAATAMREAIEAEGLSDVLSVRVEDDGLYIVSNRPIDAEQIERIRARAVGNDLDVTDASTGQYL